MRQGTNESFSRASIVSSKKLSIIVDDDDNNNKDVENEKDKHKSSETGNGNIPSLKNMFF